MNKEIRLKLIELARLKTTWSYSQLNEQLQLGYDFSLHYYRDLIGEVLGGISEHEYSKGRPLLSSLIVHESDRLQGDGFYKMCEKIGFGQWEKLKTSKKFEIERIKECYEFWKNDGNNKKYKNDF